MQLCLSRAAYHSNILQAYFLLKIILNKINGYFYLELNVSLDLTHANSLE